MNGLENTWIKLFDDPRLQKYLTETHPFVLSDPSAAQAFQQELMKRGNLGKYDYKQNSCVSHCIDVLQKGGANIDEIKKVVDDIIANLPPLQ